MNKFSVPSLQERQTLHTKVPRGVVTTEVSSPKGTSFCDNRYHGSVTEFRKACVAVRGPTHMSLQETLFRGSCLADSSQWPHLQVFAPRPHPPQIACSQWQHSRDTTAGPSLLTQDHSPKLSCPAVHGTSFPVPFHRGQTRRLLPTCTPPHSILASASGLKKDIIE